MDALRENIRDLESVMRQEGKLGMGGGCDPSHYNRLESMMINIQHDIESLRRTNSEPQASGVNQLLVAALTKLATAPTQLGGSEPTCYRCGLTGHYANTCFKSETATARENIQRECYRCGDVGHFARSCHNFGASAQSRSRDQGNRTPGRERSLGRTKSGQTYCQFCNGLGHTAVTCERLKAELKGAEKKN